MFYLHKLTSKFPEFDLADISINFFKEISKRTNKARCVFIWTSFNEMAIYFPVKQKLWKPHKEHWIYQMRVSVEIWLKNETVEESYSKSVETKMLLIDATVSLSCNVIGTTYTIIIKTLSAYRRNVLTS